MIYELEIIEETMHAGIKFKEKRILYIHRKMNTYMHTANINITRALQ